MTKNDKSLRKIKRYRQSMLKAILIQQIVFNTIVVFIIMFIVLLLQTKIKHDAVITVRESQVTQSSTQAEDYHNTISASSGTSEIGNIQEKNLVTFTYSKDWDQNDGYLLAKIAMAEAESCSIETKELIILCVLNRVWSKEFPNTVSDVLFQKSNDVYQFTPIGNGRWDSIEPNEECYEAVENVMLTLYDNSQGALYFESCSDSDNWHSKNLEYLYESDNIRFYK